MIYIVRHAQTDWNLQGVNFNDPNENSFYIEMLPDLQKRLSSFWDMVLEKYQGKNVLVVTHAGVVMWTQVYFFGMPANNDFRQYRPNNCEVVQIDNSKPLKVGF